MKYLRGRLTRICIEYAELYNENPFLNVKIKMSLSELSFVLSTMKIVMNYRFLFCLGEIGLRLEIVAISLGPLEYL